ncbi:uncharacterized protein P884DRAFT_261488 [Thermothelomyces heterothallicus CBS 202.75]|uniref:uncharacterized protein n=1 Tax=Thermothelomyces heterothallicus CBS 202.75 TaxID=1149848 RepID=UPI003742FEC9
MFGSSVGDLSALLLVCSPCLLVFVVEDTRRPDRMSSPGSILSYLMQFPRHPGYMLVKLSPPCERGWLRESGDQSGWVC